MPEDHGGDAEGAQKVHVTIAIRRRPGRKLFKSHPPPTLPASPPGLYYLQSMGVELVVVGLVIGLPLYNLLANRWPPFNGVLFVPMNLAVTFLVLLLAVGPLELARTEIVGSTDPWAALLGLVLGAVVATPLFILCLFDRGARLVRDERVADLRGGALAYQIFVRITLGTALLEEVAFRGVLLAAWRDSGNVQAAIATSVVFGLWHVGPTINLVQANRPDASVWAIITAVAGAVLFTTLGGLVLAWLRIEIGLLGPLAMHATVNGLATFASVIAARRVTSVLSSPL